MQLNFEALFIYPKCKYYVSIPFKLLFTVDKF